MKKLLRLCCGNKGFFLSLDIIIALFIVGILLTASLFFVLRANNDSIFLLQQTKIVNDAVSVLDYNKKFDSLNKNNIRNNLNLILPENYNMSFRLECKNKIIQDLGMPRNKFIAGGERIIATDNLDFCVMRYWLWSE